MRLGSDTGSLINYVTSGTKGQPTPVIGMGITELGWTDRHAGTITRVSPSGKRFWYTLDTATRVDTNGMSEVQSYTFTSNPDGPERMASLRKNGAFKHGSMQIRLGDRSEYYDFSF